MRSNPSFKPRETDLDTGLHYSDSGDPGDEWKKVQKMSDPNMEKVPPTDAQDELIELEALEGVAAEPGQDLFVTLVRSLPSWTQPKQLLDLKDALVVPVTEDGPKEALKRLDTMLMERKSLRLISHKQTRPLGVVRVTDSTMAAYTHGASTKLVINPGLYRRNAGYLRTWVERDCDLSQDHIRIGAVLFQRLHQNAASVVQGPDGNVYVVEGRSFVAWGQYTVLGTVNQLNLAHRVVDPHSKNVLGFYEEVTSRGAGVVATFVRVPQGNLATVVREQEFSILPAGSYVLCDRGVKLGTFMTTKESEATLAGLKSFTREQIPLLIDLHIKFSLKKPLKFVASTNFVNAIDLLEELVQSILLTVVSEERYRANMEGDDDREAHPSAPPLGKDKEEEAHKGSLACLSFIRRVGGLVLREVRLAASSYGVLVSSVTIRRIGFEAGLAKELDQLSKDIATASSRAMLVRQRNETALREAEGALQVSKLQGQAKAASKVAEEQALLESELSASKRRAEAAAQALHIETEARARAIRELADAEASVTSPYAQQMSLLRENQKKWESLGDKSLVVMDSGDGSSSANDTFNTAFSAGLGASVASRKVDTSMSDSPKQSKKKGKSH